MTPAESLASHRGFIRDLGETVTVRRYSGTGPGRTAVEADIGARCTGYLPNEIVGDVIQGDTKVIAINDPGAIVAAGKVSLASLLPLTNRDKLVIAGRETAIMAADDKTRRIQGVLIALVIQARG